MDATLRAYYVWMLWTMNILMQSVYERKISTRIVEK